MSGPDQDGLERLRERRHAYSALVDAANRFDRAYPELRDQVRELYAAVADALRRADHVRPASGPPR